MSMDGPCDDVSGCSGAEGVIRRSLTKSETHSRALGTATLPVAHELKYCVAQ
jgi:hypothetical protein